MDNHPLPQLTAPEKHRIDRAEQAIVGLSGRMDGVESRLVSVETAVTKTNDGVQILLSRTGTLEASRGTIPVQTLMAALALFLTLVGIGLKFLSDLEVKLDTRIENVTKQESLQHALTETKLQSVAEQVGLRLDTLDGETKQGVAESLEKLQKDLEQAIRTKAAQTAPN